MRQFWSREHIVRRIDRCYLLAAASKIPEVRSRYVERARQYRRMLSGVSTVAV